jgi:hypothetical protein
MRVNRQQSARERRDRDAGQATQDWLQAEREIQAFVEAIADSHDYDEDIRAKELKGKGAGAIFEVLSQCDVQSGIAVVDAGVPCAGGGAAR